MLTVDMPLLIDWSRVCLSVPTFISFLQDVESPYEVHDYVKMYLGESRESSEFARQFLERRSRYKEKQRKQQEMVRIDLLKGHSSTSHGFYLWC